MALDLAISIEKYSKIVTQVCAILNSLFQNHVVFTYFWHLFRLASVHQTEVWPKQNKNGSTKLEKIMSSKIWQFQLGNALKLSHKKNLLTCDAQQFFSKLLCWLNIFYAVFHMFRCIKQRSDQKPKKLHS